MLKVLHQEDHRQGAVEDVAVDPDVTDGIDDICKILIGIRRLKNAQGVLDGEHSVLNRFDR